MRSGVLVRKQVRDDVPACSECLDHLEAAGFLDKHTVTPKVRVAEAHDHPVRHAPDEFDLSAREKDALRAGDVGAFAANRDPLVRLVCFHRSSLQRRGGIEPANRYTVESWPRGRTCGDRRSYCERGYADVARDASNQRWPRSNSRA